MSAGPTAIVCGIDGCEQPLYRTHRPASWLWCDRHGFVGECYPSPPLVGTVLLTFATHCDVAELADLQ